MNRQNLVRDSRVARVIQISSFLQCCCYCSSYCRRRTFHFYLSFYYYNIIILNIYRTISPPHHTVLYMTYNIIHTRGTALLSPLLLQSVRDHTNTLLAISLSLSLTLHVNVRNSLRGIPSCGWRTRRRAAAQHTTWNGRRAARLSLSLSPSPYILIYTASASGARPALCHRVRGREICCCSALAYTRRRKRYLSRDTQFGKDVRMRALAPQESAPVKYACTYTGEHRHARARKRVDAPSGRPAKVSQTDGATAATPRLPACRLLEPPVARQIGGNAPMGEELTWRTRATVSAAPLRARAVSLSLALHVHYTVYVGIERCLCRGCRERV